MGKSAHSLRVNGPSAVGPAGRNGSVVVSFTPPAAGHAGTATACVTVGKAVLGRLRATPIGFYVDITTAKFPDGAVRGQLF